MSDADATAVMTTLFQSFLAANIAPLSMLRSIQPAPISVDAVASCIESSVEPIQPAFRLSAPERQALHTLLQDARSSTLSLDRLCDLAALLTFRVEMLEFQIRSALQAKAARKHTPSQVPIQRVIAKLLSLSQPTAETKQLFSTRELEQILEAKLALANTESNMLGCMVFCRISHKPLLHPLPSEVDHPRADFAAAWERFFDAKSLSIDTVEGQLRAMVRKHANLARCFQRLDVDQSGAISAEELIQFLQRDAGMSYPHVALDEFIQRFDVNSDGMLSYEEFLAFVQPQQLGVHVLTTYGMFYQSITPQERMDAFMEKLRTRMFWMQHTDLIDQASERPRPRAAKLKVSDKFLLLHHFGTMRLHFAATDLVTRVLQNGEMVMLVPEQEYPAAVAAATSTTSANVPTFQFRMKTKSRRAVPRLLRDELKAQREERETRLTNWP